MRSNFASTAGAKKLQSCQRTTGSARTSPAYMHTVSVVVNGSAMPSVTGRVPSGSGWLSQSRILLWKTYATIVPTPTAPMTTKSRPRSSSRCSSSVASSP